MKRKQISEIISTSDLNKILSYNPKTGKFKHKVSTTRRKAGDEAGFNNNGYLRIRINKEVVAAHRLAWFIVHNDDPLELIDHINGIKTDNRIENLRLATYSQNSMNSKVNSLNTSGIKGVMWSERKKRWLALGKINGKKIQIGSFSNINDAANAYRQFAEKNHGEFYRNK